MGVGLVGSNALYRAKLNWIKVRTCWVRTVLTKGIFSTFGSVKSLLLDRTGNKMRSRFLFPFKEKASVVIEEGPAAEMKQGAQRDWAITQRLFCLQSRPWTDVKGFIMVVLFQNNLSIDWFGNGETRMSGMENPIVNRLSYSYTVWFLVFNYALRNLFCKGSDV